VHAVNAQGSEHSGPLNFTSVLDRGFWSAICSSLSPTVTAHGTHGIGGWVVPREILPLAGIEVWFLGFPGHSVGTISTTLAWHRYPPVHTHIFQFQLRSSIYVCIYSFKHQLRCIERLLLLVLEDLIKLLQSTMFCSLQYFNFVSTLQHHQGVRGRVLVQAEDNVRRDVAARQHHLAPPAPLVVSTVEWDT
jgi:hypothetical protein